MNNTDELITLLSNEVGSLHSRLDEGSFDSIMNEINKLLEVIITSRSVDMEVQNRKSAK